MIDYHDFIQGKSQLGGNYGFAPTWEPDQMFGFQRQLVDWSVRKGRAAIMADCGLGKTFMQLAWAENIARHTGKPVLILTPLAVGSQTVHEAEKFGIEAARSQDGQWKSARIVVTNYERLHHFHPSDFSGVVCDESGILKNFDGSTKAAVTEFLRTMPYRLLCTATAAPNDYIELGTHSEALGELGYIEMLQKFFKANDGSYAQGGGAQGRTRFSGANSFGGKFRFRGHAERDFWRWVCSWARALRKPSDLGFPDDGYELPPLQTNLHVVQAKTAHPDFLFDLPAHGLEEQRAERKRTLGERCEMAASLANSTKKAVVVWCHLNTEGDYLKSLIPDAVQVSGQDSDESKEDAFNGFSSGHIRVLITKPKIGAWGLNWQHCAHQITFPSHSFEQWYQSIRRSWRFGQKSPVQVDVVTSEGEASVLANLQRKTQAAEKMFARLVELMNDQLSVNRTQYQPQSRSLPSWMTL